MRVRGRYFGRLHGAAPKRHLYGGPVGARFARQPSFEDNLWSAAAIVQHDAGQGLSWAKRPDLGLPIPWQSLYAQGARFEAAVGRCGELITSLLIMGLPR